MSVKYGTAARKKPGEPESQPKYYPSVKSSGRVTLRQLSKRIAQISTVSTVDTMAVLEALLTVIPEELTLGNIVALGDLGTFWLRIKSTGSDNPEDVSAHNIVNTLPRFTPGKEFKQVLDTIDYVKDQISS